MLDKNKDVEKDVKEKQAKTLTKVQTNCLTLTTQYEKVLIKLAKVFNLSRSETLEIAIRRLYDNIRTDSLRFRETKKRKT